MPVTRTLAACQCHWQRCGWTPRDHTGHWHHAHDQEASCRPKLATWRGKMIRENPQSPLTETPLLRQCQWPLPRPVRSPLALAGPRGQLEGLGAAPSGGGSGVSSRPIKDSDSEVPVTQLRVVALARQWRLPCPLPSHGGMLARPGPVYRISTHDSGLRPFWGKQF
jgi:hypothetical protein